MQLSETVREKYLKKREYILISYPKYILQKELGKRIAETVSETDKLLILRAEKGSSDLTDFLDKSGIIYDDIKNI